MTKSGTTATTLDLAIDLLSRRSVTPEDAGCQKTIADRLSKLGFKIEPMQFGDTSNLWARRGTEAPLFVFAGHTDVVPTGAEELWKNPPFEPKVIDGALHGRGAADMKTGIAAMVTATERFLDQRQPVGSIGFLLTSDEEGFAVDGTVKVVEVLTARGEKIDYCIVGEPTSVTKCGDTVKNGRRGSLSGRLKILGIQGHVAYPERAENPIHRFAPALTELAAEQWDQGNEFFTPTTMQFSNISAGTGVENVVPGTLEAIFNFRFASCSSSEMLQKRTEAILHKHNLRFELAWRILGQPFLTQPGTMTTAVIKAIRTVTGIDSELSTTGGTSDARFIAPTGAQVIECGLINTTIHKVDEHASVSDIDTLSKIYEEALKNLL